MTNEREGGRAWTEEDVREILHNPIYVGLGTVPAIVEEQVWIRAQERNFAEQGVRPTLRRIRQVLTAHLGMTPASMASKDWLDRAYLAIAQEGAEPYFRALLASLRAELSEPLN